MKKTLFVTMLAAALMGGQVFADPTGTAIEGYDTEHSTGNNYYGKYSEDVSVSGGDVTVKADLQGTVSPDAHVYGGYATKNSDSASNNTVTMTGGEVGYVYGGFAMFGQASNNVVIVTGGSIRQVIYGGCSSELDSGVNNNRVHLVGKGASNVSITNGQGSTSPYGYTGSDGGIATNTVYASYKYEGPQSEGNSIDIYGTGITVAYELSGMQILTFNVTNAQMTGQTPEAALTHNAPAEDDWACLNLEGVELQVNDLDVASWTPGSTITLVQSTQAIQGFTEPQDVEIKRGDEVTATGTLQLADDGMSLFLTNIQGVGPVPAAGADALDVTLVNSLWASSAYVREFVRLSGAQGYALKNGDTAVWGGGFGAFMHVTGDKGFKSNGGGYGIGVNHAFSDNTQGGVSFGQGFGSYHNSGADGATVHQRAILAAATASTRIGKDFSLGGHLAYGSVRNRADCRLDGATERARWNDNVFNLGAQAAYDFHMTERTAITPFLGLDWAYGAQESINGAYARHYSHGRLNELRMPVGVTVSTSAEVGTTTLLPHLSVAYVPSLAQQNPHAGVTGADGNYRVKGYAPGRNAFMLNAGVNAVFSGHWSAGASYTLETCRHAVDQSVNASVRYTF